MDNTLELFELTPDMILLEITKKTEAGSVVWKELEVAVFQATTEVFGSLLEIQVARAGRYHVVDIMASGTRVFGVSSVIQPEVETLWLLIDYILKSDFVERFNQVMEELGTFHRGRWKTYTMRLRGGGLHAKFSNAYSNTFYLMSDVPIHVSPSSKIAVAFNISPEGGVRNFGSGWNKFSEEGSSGQLNSGDAEWQHIFWPPTNGGITSTGRAFSEVLIFGNGGILSDGSSWNEFFEFGEGTAVLGGEADISCTGSILAIGTVVVGGEPDVYFEINVFIESGTSVEGYAPMTWHDFPDGLFIVGGDGYYSLKTSIVSSSGTRLGGIAVQNTNVVEDPEGLGGLVGGESVVEVVDVIDTHNTLYLTNTTDLVLEKYNLITKSVTTLETLPAVPNYFVYDYSNKIFFWSDSTSIRQRSENQIGYTTLAQGQVEVAIDPVNRWVYYVQNNQYYRVYYVPYGGGTTRNMFTPQSGYWLGGIYFEKDANKFWYVMNAYTGSKHICYQSVTYTDRPTIPSSSGLGTIVWTSDFGMADLKVSENYIWVYGNNAIYRIDKDGSNSQIVYTSDDSVLGFDIDEKNDIVYVADYLTATTSQISQRYYSNGVTTHHLNSSGKNRNGIAIAYGAAYNVIASGGMRVGGKVHEHDIFEIASGGVKLGRTARWWGTVHEWPEGFGLVTGGYAPGLYGRDIYVVYKSRTNTAELKTNNIYRFNTGTYASTLIMPYTYIIGIRGIAVDKEYNRIYLAKDAYGAYPAGIYSFVIGAAAPTQVLSTTGVDYLGLDSKNGMLYWTNGTQVRRGQLNRSTGTILNNQILYTNSTVTFSRIAVDVRRSRVFVSAKRYDSTAQRYYHSIYRMNPNGTGVQKVAEIQQNYQSTLEIRGLTVAEDMVWFVFGMGPYQTGSNYIYLFDGDTTRLCEPGSGLLPKTVQHYSWWGRGIEYDEVNNIINVLALSSPGGTQLWELHTLNYSVGPYYENVSRVSNITQPNFPDDTRFPVSAWYDYDPYHVCFADTQYVNLVYDGGTKVSGEIDAASTLYAGMSGGSKISGSVVIRSTVNDSMSDGVFISGEAPNKAGFFMEGGVSTGGSAQYGLIYPTMISSGGIRCSGQSSLSLTVVWYVFDAGQSQIFRWEPASGMTSVIQTAATNITNMAGCENLTQGDYIFYSVGSTIYRKVPYDNGSPGELMYTDSQSILCLMGDDDNGKLYWISGTSLRRSNLDGSSVESLFTVFTATGSQYLLDLPNQRYFYVNEDSYGNDRINRVSFGTPTTSTLIYSGAGDKHGLVNPVVNGSYTVNNMCLVDNNIWFVQTYTVQTGGGQAWITHIDSNRTSSQYNWPSSAILSIDTLGYKSAFDSRNRIYYLLLPNNQFYVIDVDNLPYAYDFEAREKVTIFPDANVPQNLVFGPRPPFVTGEVGSRGIRLGGRAGHIYLETTSGGLQCGGVAFTPQSVDVYMVDYTSKRIAVVNNSDFNQFDEFYSAVNTTFQGSISLHGTDLYFPCSSGLYQEKIRFQKINIFTNVVSDIFTTPDISVGDMFINPNDNKLYWVGYPSSSSPDYYIRRSNLDGSNLETVYTDNTSTRMALDEDNNRIFYERGQDLYRMSVDGSNTIRVTNLSSDRRSINGICVVHQYVYFGTNPILKRVLAESVESTTATNVWIGKDAFRLYYDKINRTLHIVCRDADYVTSIDAWNPQPIGLGYNSYPMGVAFNYVPAGTATDLYVARSNDLIHFAKTSLLYGKQIALPGINDISTICSFSRFIYITESADGATDFYRYDINSKNIQFLFNKNFLIQRMFVDNNTSKLYCTGYHTYDGHKVFRMDLDGNNFEYLSPVPEYTDQANIGACAFKADTGRLFFACGAGTPNYVYRTNAYTSESGLVFTGTSAITGLSVIGDFLYILHGNQILKIGVNDLGKTVGTSTLVITLPRTAVHPNWDDIYYDAVNEYLYVRMSNSTIVYVIRDLDTPVLKEIGTSLFNVTRGITVNNLEENAASLYVANSTSLAGNKILKYNTFELSNPPTEINLGFGSTNYNYFSFHSCRNYLYISGTKTGLYGSDRGSYHYRYNMQSGTTEFLFYHGSYASGDYNGGISVDPVNEKIYWRGYNPFDGTTKMYCANLDGTNILDRSGDYNFMMFDVHSGKIFTIKHSGNSPYYSHQIYVFDDFNSTPIEIADRNGYVYSMCVSINSLFLYIVPTPFYIIEHLSKEGDFIQEFSPEQQHITSIQHDPVTNSLYLGSSLGNYGLYMVDNVDAWDVQTLNSVDTLALAISYV